MRRSSLETNSFPFWNSREISSLPTAETLTSPFTIVLDTVHPAAPLAGAVCFTFFGSPDLRFFGCLSALSQPAHPKKKKEDVRLPLPRSETPGLPPRPSFGLARALLLLMAIGQSLPPICGWRIPDGVFATCDLRIAANKCPTTRTQHRAQSSQVAGFTRQLDIFRFKPLPLNILQPKFPQNIENKDSQNRGMGTLKCPLTTIPAAAAAVPLRRAT